MSKTGDFFKRITGVKAYEDRKKAKKIEQESSAKYENYKKQTLERQKLLSIDIDEFTTMRLETLKETLALFFRYLEDIGQKNGVTEYQLLDGCDIDISELTELKDINLSVNELLEATVTTGVLSAVTLAGVPVAVSSTVAALASASTGTAITTLAGAAKTNAILAWLGGGSLAVGGGGMAAGAAVLTGVTWAATGLVALISGGLIASQYFSGKLTSAEDNKAKIDISCAEMEKSWEAIKMIQERLNEFNTLSKELAARFNSQLVFFEPIIPDFTTSNPYHLQCFQKQILLVKSLSDLARTPILDDDMNVSKDGDKIILKINKILNTEL